VSASSWKGALIYRKTKGGKKGALKPTLANSNTILANEECWQGVIVYNEYADRIETTKAPPWHTYDAPSKASAGPWTDADDARTVAWLQREWDITISVELAHEVVRIVASRKAVNPLCECLDEAEREWVRDGSQPRLDTWLVVYCGAEDTAYVRTVGAKWPIAAVARAKSPGVQADNALVLVGPQNAGKSSVFRKLAIRSEWHLESKIDMKTREGAIALAGRWIVELSELASLADANNETADSFLTLLNDKFMPRFGRTTVERPRGCIFAGTTDKDRFLKGEAGKHRRMWPVAVGKIDLEALERDRILIWGEAVWRFRHGEAWHLTDVAMIAAAQEQQELRRTGDGREELLATWLRGEAKVRDKAGNVTTVPHAKRGVTTAEALVDGLDMPKYRADRGAQMDAASALRALKWEKCTTKHERDGKRCDVFFPAATGCPKHRGRERERERDRKKVVQVVQVVQSPAKTRKNGAQPRRKVVQDVVHANGTRRAGKPAFPQSSEASTGIRARGHGAGEPAHAASRHSSAPGGVATAPALPRPRGRRRVTFTPRTTR
jgi:putative DNA primase/helicase